MDNLISTEGDEALAHDLQAHFKANDIELSHKQALFVYYFCIYNQPPKAARLAGYSENTIYTTAYENLAKPLILLAISLRKKQIREENAPTHERLSNFLGGLVDMDLTQMIDVDVAKNTCTFKDMRALKNSGIGKYVESITVGKRGVTVKIMSKSAAAEMLSKHTGYFEQDNKQRKSDAVQIYIPDNNRGLAETPEEGEIEK